MKRSQIWLLHSDVVSMTSRYCAEAEVSLAMLCNIKLCHRDFGLLVTPPPPPRPPPLVVVVAVLLLGPSNLGFPLEEDFFTDFGGSPAIADFRRSAKPPPF